MQTEIKQISLREVLHFLGWHGSPLEPQWISTLHALCERVKKEVHPRVIFRRFPIESGGRLQGTNWAAQGEDARALLASCEEAVLFAATLGAESERMLLREQAVSAEGALLLDAVLSAAIESVRLSKTDIPVLVCAASADERGVRVALGSRPSRAVIVAENARPEELDYMRMAADVPMGSNARASEAYRRKVAPVLMERAVQACLKR